MDAILSILFVEIASLIEVEKLSKEKSEQFKYVESNMNLEAFHPNTKTLCDILVMSGQSFSKMIGEKVNCLPTATDN